MGIGGSSSSSKPVDMTPQAFKNLQGPFASVFASLLGFGPPGGPGNGTGWQPNGNGGYTQGSPSGSGSPTGSQWGGTGGTQGFPAGWKGMPKPGSVTGYYPIKQTTHSNSNTGTPYAPMAPGTNPNDILRGIPGYTGDLTAGIGANEQTLLDQMMQQVGGANGSGGPSQNAQNYLDQVMSGAFMPGQTTPQGMSAFTQMLQGSRQTQGYQGTMDEMNPFLNAAIQSAQRPTLQGLEETLSRELPGRFTEAGQFKQPGASSAFDRAAGVATRGAADAMADIATNLSYATYEAERGRTFEAQEGARSREDAQMASELDRQFSGREGERNRQNEAAGLTSTIQTQEMDNMVKNLQAQALPRLIQEFGIERGIEQFNNKVNTLLATLGIAQGVTAPTIGQSQKSSGFQASIK
jgi:hypothetical protein